MRSIATSCARCGDARAAISCAPICVNRTRAKLWQFYIQLVEVEAAFKTMKDDLHLRPIYHQLEERIEAHIFVAFLAYCLHVTLRARLKPMAGGLTPRAVLDKLAAVQMLDVHFPTTDGRTLILTRYTEFSADQKLLVKMLKLDLPPQPPPRITAPRTASPPIAPAPDPPCSGDFRYAAIVSTHFFPPVEKVGLERRISTTCPYKQGASDRMPLIGDRQEPSDRS